MDSGDILVYGRNIAKRRNLRQYFQEDVGFLFQNFALVENKTVAENLQMIHRNANSTVSMGDALERVGLAGKEAQKVYTLSGGEQQRVALARLMMKKCRLILADEPTGSLDRGNATQVMDCLSALHTAGITIVMVTHDASLLSRGTQTVKL